MDKRYEIISTVNDCLFKGCPSVTEACRIIAEDQSRISGSTIKATAILSRYKRAIKSLESDESTIDSGTIRLWVAVLLYSVKNISDPVCRDFILDRDNPFSGAVFDQLKINPDKFRKKLEENRGCRYACS